MFIALVSVLTAIAELGMARSAVVFAGRESETAGDVHRVLLGYVPALSVTSVVAGSIVLALAGEMLVPGFPQGWLWLVFIAVPLSLYANFWNNLMVGVRRLVPMNLVQLAGGALTLFLNVVLVMALGRRRRGSPRLRAGAGRAGGRHVAAGPWAGERW